jgi:hypothetical protein
MYNRCGQLNKVIILTLILYKLLSLHSFQVQAYSSDVTLATISDLTGTSTGTAATNAEFLVIFNKIENKINALTSPDCD